MKYISGIFALNIPCSLDTTGDWHSSSLNRLKLTLNESDDSILKEKGIERDIYIRELGGMYNVANHIRAIADLLDYGDYPTASGMRFDYLDDDRRFDRTLFEYVFAFRQTKNEREWERISSTMEKEYMLKWLKFLEEKGITKRKKTITITDSIKRRCEENADDIESIFMEARTNLFVYGGLEYLYDVCWIINHFEERLTENTRADLDSVFRYNRGKEYFEYLKAEYKVSGVAVEEIGREFMSAVTKVMPHLLR